MREEWAMRSEKVLRDHPGYGVLTVKIYYYFPDRPLLINPLFIVRQFNDACPEFPTLHEYLMWWEKNIDGRLESVSYAHRLLLKQSEVRVVKGVFQYGSVRH